MKYNKLKQKFIEFKDKLIVKKYSKERMFNTNELNLFAIAKHRRSKVEMY